MFCVNCGKKIEDDSSFCPYCGTSCRDTHATPNKSTSFEHTSAKRPDATLIYCLIGFVVVLLIAAFVFLGVNLLNSKDDSSDTQTASVESQESNKESTDVVGMENTTTATPVVTATAVATPLPTAIATPIPTATAAPAVPVSPFGDYILPYSNSSYLSDSEVLALVNSSTDAALYNTWYVPYRGNVTQTDCGGYTLYLARNEIAARHGRTFSNGDLQAYFNSKSWYSPTISADDYDYSVDSILNAVEKSNAALIQSYEGQYGYTGKF